MSANDYYNNQGKQYYPPQGPPPGQGGYYPQQPQQAYYSGGPPQGYPQQGGYQPQPPPQTVYVYVHESVANSISTAEPSLFTDNNHSRAQAAVVDVVRVWQECVYAAALKNSANVYCNLQLARCRAWIGPLCL
ncbi:hypothetical protein F5876DRAFT_73183 [Lentinula aff. lateritia]|uniref:Uncharacterized protein n=1 Tax=Lentinula aff. lateritia TaxID=2804960 RepID=A0ACC1UAS4_9AGAR|nr:hypothetical protein F5876DRAFT_73183 [Lentinula aff. lateritia]